jgi:hypothetical protein
LCLKKIVNRIATTKAYPAKESQIPCQSLFPPGRIKYLPITQPLIILPSQAPTPFVIIINKPCALDLILESVVVSTNKEPEILKKSNAIP